MRDAIVTFDFHTLMYTIQLRDNQLIINTREVANYHDIGSIISNWLHNGF